MTNAAFPAPAPTTRRVRAYFAPVERATQSYAALDAEQIADMDLDCPPAPWIDLGYIQNFARKSASKSAPIFTGIPAAAQEQTRQTLATQLSFEFLSWTKLTMALATGSQHMNVLAPAQAVAIQNSSTASTIQLSEEAASFAPGSMIAVDLDYAGQTGFVGSPVSGAYLRQPLTDADYIRRITFNVGLVLGVTSDSLILAKPLAGGAPAPGARVQAVTGFVDREGGSFYQEWSGLFVMEGSQGDRIFFYYPRLQSATEAEETSVPLDNRHKGGLARVLLKAQFLALPILDPLDGERVLCYRSFKPAAYSLI